LRNIFRAGSKKILKLDTGKLFNDLGFLLDALLETFFKLFKFAFFFVKILDQSSTPFLHLS